MIKRLALYGLPKDADGDAFWEYHTTVHGPDTVRITGDHLVKYVINRVGHTVKGDQKAFGIVETWWRDEASMQEGFDLLGRTKLPDGKTAAEDYFARVDPDANRAFEVEEVVVVDPPRLVSGSRPGIKRISFYDLAADVDGDDFWQYHIDRHARESVESFGPHLKGYAINRVTQRVRGDASVFGIVALWFDSAEDMARGFAAHESVILPNGRNVSDDFNERVTGAFAFETMEFIVKDESPSAGPGKQAAQ